VHVEADRFEQIGNHGAIGGAATVSDMQWAGRIGRDELDLDPPAGAEAAATIVGTGVEDARHQHAIGVLGQEEIDESGAGDLHSRHQR
jgi:hypothetical protein